MFQQLQEMDMEFDRSCEVLPPDGWIEVGDFSVAGTSYHFRECEMALKNFPFELRFERDPGNRHDSNAIKIMYKNHHLGFVPREDAAELANDPDFPRMKPFLRRAWRGRMDDGEEVIAIQFSVFKEPRELRVSCPKCGRHYVVDEADASCEVECVKCGERFVARDQETKRCPMCGEEILAVAKKCKHCGEYLDGASREPERRTAGEHFSKQKPLRVDTGENFLNRNRGCADLLLYGPIIVVILAVICYVLDALFG